MKNEKKNMEQECDKLKQELIITKEKLSAVINELTSLEMKKYKAEHIQKKK